MEAISLCIAIVTNILCIALFTISICWWWRLRESDTDFRNWFLGTAVLMLGLWTWPVTGILQLWYLNMTLPAISLPTRLIVMTALIIKLVTTMRGSSKTKQMYGNDPPVVKRHRRKKEIHDEHT